MEENYLERIKNLKSEKKITNEQLSRMTGIPLGTLSKFLAGISDSVKLSNIIAVCNALDCSLDYIISGQPENTNNYTLDMGEIKLIEDYRRLDAHGRELVLLVLGKEAERISSIAFTYPYNEPLSSRAKMQSAAATAKRPGRLAESARYRFTTFPCRQVRANILTEKVRSI